MANLGFVFNAAEHNPEMSASLPVAQKQLMVIYDSSIEATAKDKSNGMVVLNVRYADGPNQGAEGTIRLNLFHANQQAVEIAKRQLSAIAHCVGVPTVTDTAQLHNIPFRADVDYQKGHNPATDGADAKGYTEVKRFYDANGNPPKGGQFGGVPQQQAPQQQQNFGQQSQGGFQQQQNPAQGQGGWGGNPQQQQPAQQGGWQGQTAQGGQPQQQGAWGNQQQAQGGQQQPAWGNAGQGNGQAWK